ncbi:hypothetical protein C4F17_10220 [Variovorax sp. PMC12]|nr:hypothetical protein C4F17_10220 [Variovorax sp. PMC12]
MPFVASPQSPPASADRAPPPAKPTINPTNGGSISGTAEPGATVAVSSSTGTLIGSTTAAPDGTYVVRPAVPVPDGTVLRVIAKNPDGSASSEARATVDSQAPFTPTVDSTDGNPVTGTAEPGALITVRDGAGNLVGSATAEINGAYSVTPVTTPADGTLLRVVASDAAGNASIEATAIVDSKPPAAPTANPTNGSSITGTAEAGAVVTIRDGTGNVIASTTAGSNGAYSVVPTDKPVDGADLRIVATDRAGNTGPEARVTVDGKPPIAPSVNLTNGSSITGTAEAGATVLVRDGSNNVIGSATTRGDGSYSMSPATIPADGTELRVTVTDSAGNVSPETRGRVDGHLLDTPTVSPTNGSSITGTAGAGALVTIKDGAGTVIGSGTVALDGTYSVIPVAAPAHGTELSVVVSDPAGKASPEAKVTVDSNPPFAPTAEPTNGRSITGVAERGVLVTIKDGAGNLIGSAIAAANGSYKIAPQIPPADGAVLHAVATDRAGNVSLESTTVVDSKSPPAPSINPTNGRLITGLAEADALIVVKDDAGNVIGSATTATNGAYSITPSTVPADGTMLHATATDSAGNVGVETTATVDRKEPFAPKVGPTNGNAITGTAEAGSTVTIRDMAGAVLGSATVANDGSYSVAPVSRPSDGVVLSVVATDSAGNVSPETKATVDGKAPPAPSIKPTNGSLITGTAEVDAVVTVKDGSGAVIGSATAAADGTYSLTPATKPADGAELRVMAADSAGNASLETKVTVDSKSPDEPKVNPTNGKLITGTAEVGSVITIKDASGNVVATATVKPDGSYSVVPAVPPAHGAELRVAATDPSGNVSLEARIEVDSKALDMPKVDPTNGRAITGVAAAGALVTIKDATGAVVGSVTAAADGKYSITPASAPTDGAELSVSATDTAGNASPVAKIRVDGMPPAAPTANPTNGTSITGTAEIGSLVTVKDASGAVIGSVTAEANGSYSITPVNAPAEGAALRVIATDAAGNPSTETRITVDSTSPPVPTVDPANGTRITGNAEAGAVVTVKDGSGKTIGSATAATDGAYSVTPVAVPADGTELSVVATDPAGNASPEARIKVDSKAPPAPTVNPTNGTSITGTAEAGALVSIRNAANAVIGSATVAGDGKYSITPVPAPADGTELRVVVTDRAGNASQEAPVVVDGTAPAAPTIRPSNGTSVSGTAEAGALVTIKDGAGAVIGSVIAAADDTYRFNPALKLANGTELRIVATDRAGNAGLEAKAVVDDAPPPVPTVDPTDGRSITGTTEAGALVTIRNGASVVIGSATAAANGKYSITPATPPANGTELRVDATDAAGNTSSEASVTVDSKSPDMPTVNPTNGSSVTGTAEVGALVLVKDSAGNIIGSATTANDGVYSIAPASTPADGTVLRIVAIDRAGNASFEAGTTVDRTPPPAPMLDAGRGNALTGKAEVGALVTVRDDAGKVIGSATAAPDGTYGITPSTALMDGAVLHAVATDRAGNVGSEATATVDRKEPPAPTVEPSNGKQVAGRAEAGAIVTIKDGSGTVIGSATAAGDGSYRVTPATSLSDGVELSIAAIDRAGNASSETKIIVDGKAPVAPIVKPTSGSFITGTAEAGTLVTIRDDAGNAIGSATAAADDRYSITPATALAHGTVLHVVATDHAGNASIEATASVDSKPPFISIAIVNDANNDGFINASEKGVEVSVKVTLVSGAAVGDVISLTDGSKTASVTLTASDVANGFLDVAFDNPVEGAAISVSATSRDLAGNVSTPAATDSAVLDTTLAAPAISVAAITSDNVVNMAEAGGAVAVSGTTAGTQSGDVVTLQVNGVAYSSAVDASGNWRVDVAGSDLAADAGRTVAASVVSHDAAGNTASGSKNHGYGVSSTAPLITIEKPVAGDDQVSAKEDDAVVVRGTTTNVESGQIVKVTFSDGTNSVTATATVSGSSWTAAAADISGLTNGTVTITAEVQDLAQNQATSTHAVTLGNAVPMHTVEITSYTDDVGVGQGDFGSGTRTDDPHPVLKGKMSAAIGANDVVRIYEGSQLLGTATVDGTNWTYELGFLADGSSHTYRAVVTGAAGTEGAMSSDFSLTADYALTVDSQNTVDPTPLVNGTMPFKLVDGQYIEVTIDGKTYSSVDGSVQIDAQHSIWYVQVPAAMQRGSYDVKAVVKSASGTQITTDDTAGELIVSEEPKVTVGSAASDPHQKGTAYTVGENGMWRIHSNQTMLDADGTNNATLGSFKLTALKSNAEKSVFSEDYNPTYKGNNFVQNATFIDVNRDGHMDLFTEDSTPSDGQQAFIFDGSSYTALQVGGRDYNYKDKTLGPAGGDSNVNSSFSGVVAFDKTGTGFVSVAYGDQPRRSGTSVEGNDSQIVLNTDGNIRKMARDTGYTNIVGSGAAKSTNAGNAPFDTELSGVDLNNDGTIDLVYHATAYTTKIGGPSADPALAETKQSKEPHRLVVASNKGDGTWENTQIIENAFQNIANQYAFFGNGISMTWADFNGDGYMDLFMGRGYGKTPDEQYQSRILLNDGRGHLEMNDPDLDKIGTTPSGMYTFGVTDGGRLVQGGPSLAVDWNGDGKMDAIELPGFGDLGGVTKDGNKGPINLYTNKSSGKTLEFVRDNLLGGTNTIGDWDYRPELSDSVTGAIAADTDWDGDRDLLVFTQKGNTRFITNTTTVADGTSLHFRILDAQGINALYGNTVQLFNSAGKLVSTQIINPQSGNQTNDSSAIVDFYGLDAKETYTLALLRIANGSAADVGGKDELGGNTIEVVNAAWTGLKAGEANHAFVLTTESGINVANANIGNGIVGTGYNDTFFATRGDDKYEGGGGTVTVSGVKAWSNTGGMDIVDYKLAGDTPLTIDLSITGAQNTGFGTATFRNIEGLAGGSSSDIFVDNAADNQFEGRGGNDTFTLMGGGRDTLLYKLLSASDATGGNGADDVYGFEVGAFVAWPNADRIDLRELLVGFTPGNEASYLKVSVVNGRDTVISVDRDGAGNGHDFAPLLTLRDLRVDLATLLSNQQLVMV